MSNFHSTTLSIASYVSLGSLNVPLTMTIVVYTRWMKDYYPRAYACFVICGENTMMAIDSFHKKFKGVLEPINALLLQKHVLSVWMN